MHYQGSCHCGDIAFAFETTDPLQKVIDCNCSHCSRKGYLLSFVPRAQFTLKTPVANLATYTFNKHFIQHHFCPRCGAAPFGLAKDSKGVETAAINVRCVEDLDLASLQREFVDGRSF